MALDLVGGSLFTLLYDGVKEAMIKTTQFKSLLADLKSTLDSLQPRIIEQIGEHNTELGLRNEEIEDLQRQMEEGVKLVGKFSEFRVWNYCCVGDYTDQLVELDRALRRLLDMLRLQEARDVKETLLLSRQNRDKLDEVNKRLIEIQKLLVLQQQQAGGMAEATDSGNNTEANPEPVQGNGIQAMAALDGGEAVEVVFGMLFDAVLEVENRAVMFKTPLGDLKSTLVSLKPLIEEVSHHNKVLVRPKEELEKLTKEMEKGVELIPKCSEVHPWTSYKKFTYTEKLIGLENFLQRQLYILKRQVARDVRNTLDSIRKIEMAIEQIEKSGALLIQVQSDGCSEVPETSRPSVGFDIVNAQERRDVEERKSSMKNKEPAIKPTEESGVVQNQLEKPSPPTVGLDVGTLQRTRDLEETMSPIQHTEAEVQPNEESGVIQNQPETKGTKNAPKDYTLLSRIYRAFSRSTIDSNTSSGAGTSLFSDEKTSTFRRKDDDQSTDLPYSELIQAERLDQEVRNTDSYTTSVAGTSLFSEEETSTFQSKDDDQSIDGHVLEKSNLRDFKFAELEIATRNFNPDLMLAEGGFGRVFKGWLDEMTLSPSKPGKGMAVAIKKLEQERLLGSQEWQSEMNFAGRLSHPNIVKLLGYCWKEKELLLVYEFMPKGSLQDHLFGRIANIKPLSWETRIKVAIGAAQGLAFLHSLEKPVILRDFKSSDVLLDGNYNAKLSDFGLAKLGPCDRNSHLSTLVVMRTYDHAAPEYVATGRLYVKSNVYNFGVVLLEILTGLRAHDTSRPKEQVHLVDWVKPFLLSKKKLKTIMDVRMEGQYSLNAAFKAVQLTINCLASFPRNRPSMKEVVEELEQILAIKKQLSPTSG